MPRPVERFEMDALVLAAGLGTRLRPLTDRLPKPAVPVANRPLVSFALEHLRRSGVTRVVLNAHHLAAALPPVIERIAPASLSARVVHEPELLGTGGGVRNLWLALRGGAGHAPLYVMNSDVVFAPDLAGALALHDRLDAIATMVLRPDPDAARYGTIEIDPAGRVRRLLGVPESAPGPLRALMFTGVHVLSPRALADLPERGCIIRSSYRAWIDRGEVVAGWVEASPWRDLGTLAQYLAANVELASGRDHWPGIVPEPRGLVGPGATISDDAEVTESVIGLRATVAPGARLDRVVVWDHTTAAGSLVRCIVTPDGIVPVHG